MGSLYQSSVLPWSRSPGDRRRLLVILVVGLVIPSLVSLIVPIIPVPEQDQADRTVPERVIRLAQKREKEPPPPPPKEEEEPEEEEPEEEEPEEEEPEEGPEEQVEEEPETPEPAAEDRQQAREEAEKRLSKVAEKLAGLADSSVLDEADPNGPLTASGGTARSNDRSVLTSGVAEGSGGIQTSKLSRSTGGRVAAPSGRETSEIESSVEDIEAPSQSAQQRQDQQGRSIESIQLAFDQKKTTLYRDYKRQLRRNPTLEGKIIFEITIEPSGRVSNVTIVSSSLNSPRLEDKLIRRIRTIDFGEKADAETTTVNFPITFVPS